MSYVVPEFFASAFNCPNCDAFSHQIWRSYQFTSNYFGASLGDQKAQSKALLMDDCIPRDIDHLSIAFCQKCRSHSVWVYEKMVYPSKTTAPPPIDNMPENVLIDYQEARDVFDKSPRASAALLRLAIQKLCIFLGGKGANLNSDIGLLVQKGLPEKIQKALDVVRVIGNNAVHPGKIDINDDPQISLSLFKLVNLIVDYMINQPEQIDTLFSTLPSSAKNSIKERDEK